MSWIARGVVAAVALLVLGAMLDRDGSGAAVALAVMAAPLLFFIDMIRGEKQGREKPERELLIVGRNRRTQDYLSRTAGNGGYVRVVGILDSEKDSDLRCGDELRSCHRALDDLRIPYLGGHQRLHEVMAHRPVDEVLITLPIKSCYDEITQCLSICHEAGILASVSTDLFELERPQPGLVRWPTGGLGLQFERTRRPRWQMALKRCVDFAGSAVAILLLGIPMLCIALAVKLGSRGPVLYWQERSGRNGKTFRFPKFRTMVVDADRIKAQLEHLNEQAGPVFKMRNDPRVTRVGRVLRKYSLDELPQLFCVLLGQMSLVGPRPPIPREVAQYEWWQRRRLSVKPGLTCFWQIQGRNSIPFDEWMRLDLKYIDEWSIWLDLKLLVLTIPAVVRGSGV